MSATSGTQYVSLNVDARHEQRETNNRRCRFFVITMIVLAICAIVGVVLSQHSNSATTFGPDNTRNETRNQNCTVIHSCPQPTVSDNREFVLKILDSLPANAKATRATDTRSVDQMIDAYLSDWMYSRSPETITFCSDGVLIKMLHCEPTPWTNKPNVCSDIKAYDLALRYTSTDQITVELNVFYEDQLTTQIHHGLDPGKGFATIVNQTKYANDPTYARLSSVFRDNDSYFNLGRTDLIGHIY